MLTLNAFRQTARRVTPEQAAQEVLSIASLAHKTSLSSSRDTAETCEP